MLLGVKRLVAVVVIAFVGYVVIDYARLNGECSRCEMSFMHPHYRQIEIANSPYRLLEYNDGAAHSEKTNEKVYIYVPGNAASYKQVRSIGSVLLSLDGGVNVYTVDLKEELSAFDIAAVERHIAFLQTCIEWIKHERPRVEITVIGHSMGAVVAKMAGCKDESVKKIVDLAGPYSNPIPLSGGFNYCIECGNKLISIQPAVNDIQAISGDCDSNIAIGVDAIPLSWSDPHHQAMVWSHSLMRALANHLVYGASLSEFEPDIDSVKWGTIEVCEEKKNLSGTFITDLKLGKDFTVDKDVKVMVVPGKYQSAQAGRVKSVIPEYLTVIRGHNFNVKRFCEPFSDAGRSAQMVEYCRNGSFFDGLLTATEEKAVSEYFDEVVEFEKTVYLLSFAIYEKSDKDVIMSVMHPDGQTIYPEKRFVSSAFGEYKIWSINGQTNLRIDVSKTLLTWINRDKRAFHKGLILGFLRRTPFVNALLLALLLFSISGGIVSIAASTMGYIMGHSLFILLFGQGPNFPPIYKYNDDLKGLKRISMITACLSIFLPYPISLLLCLPGLIYALVDINKRWKAIQIATVFVFEIASGIASALNCYRTRQLYTGPILYRLVPVLVNTSMSMHVRSFVFLPLIVLLPNMIFAAAVIATICAYSAADHERNKLKNFRKHKE